MADELKQEIDSLLGPGIPDPSIVPEKAPGVPEDPLTKWIDQAVPAPKQTAPAPAAPKAPDNLFSEIETVTGSPERFASPEKLTSPDGGLTPVLSEEEVTAPEPRPGFIEAPWRGMSRGVDMLRSAVPTLQGVYSEWTGDTEAAAQYAAEAKAIDDAAYKPIVGGFSNIKNAEDALYWMLETQGEMTPVLAAVMIGGYVGGRTGPSMVTPLLLHSAVRMGLMSPQAATVWGSTIGSVLGGALVSVPLETADTAGELRETTGRFYPELSLGSGLVKGALELFTPLGILNRVTGRTAGKSITGAVLGTAFKEGVTEALQEEVNIAARKYVDPKYSYFGEEALYRRLDSFAAGTLMGATIGGPVEAVGRRVASEQIIEEQAVEDAFSPQSPVSALKRVLPFLRTQRDNDLLTVFRANPKLDPLEVNVLLDTFGKDWAGSGVRLNNEEAFYDWMEGQTTRYAVVDEMGATTELLNPTDLERALTKFPARETLAGKIVEVDQKMLTPAGITANVTDLIQADVLQRVYFLPSVDAATKKQLITEFSNLVDSTEFKQNVLDHMFEPNEKLKAAYGAFLDKGMRVLPTAGASFNYAGEFTGKPVTRIPRTGRSLFPLRPNKALGNAVLRPVTGTLKKIREFGVDTNRLQPGDVISDNPAQWIWPASVDANTKQEQSKKFLDLLRQHGKESIPVIERLQELMDMGVHIDATNEVETLVLNKKVLVEQKLVPTSQTNAEGIRPVEEFVREVAKRSYDDQVAKVERLRLAPELERAARDMEKILAAVHPIFKKHALPTVARVIIYPSRDVNGGLYLSGNIELKFPDNLPYEQAMYVFIHELGHMVMLSAFGKLSAEKIERVYQAYRRNVLADSLTDATLAPNMEDTAWRQQTHKKWDGTYAYTFNEYLAEQFGRWMFSRGLPTNPTDGVFKEISSILREVTEGIITWNASLGDPVDARERLMPDYTFGRMMDILFELEEETTMSQKSLLGGNIQKIEALARAANDNPEREKGYGIPQFLSTYMKPDEGQSVALERAYEMYRTEQNDPANSIPYPQFRNEVANTGVTIQRIAGFDRIIGWRKATYAEREEAKAASNVDSTLRQNVLEVAAAVRQGFSIRDAIRVVIDRVKSMLSSSSADGEVLTARLGQLEKMELQSVNDNLTESPVYDNVISMRDETEFKAQRLEIPSPFRDEARQRSLLDEFYDLYQENPVFDDFEDAFAEAKQAIAPMLPKGWTIEAGAPGSGNDAVANTKTKTIVLGLGALRLGVGATLVHETIHALRAEGLFTPAEWRALVREIRQDAALWGAVRTQYSAELTRKAEKLARTIDNSGENFVRAWVRDKLEEEAVAFATSIRFAGGEIGTVSNGLIDRIIAFLRAVKEKLIGKGYISPSDVRRRIFSGQVAGRLEQDAKFARWTKREQEFASALTMPTSERTERVVIMSNPEIVQLDSDLFIAIKEMGNSAYLRMYFPPEQPFSANMSNNAKLLALGDLIGVVDLQKNKKGWEVDWVKVNKKSYERYPDKRRHSKFSDQVYAYLSERLGFTMQPSATLTKKGYDAWKFRDPQAVRYHVWVEEEGYYHSPNYIREKVVYYKSQLSSPYEETAAQAKIELQQWQAAYRQVPKEAWSDPELDRMFARTLTTGMFEAMRIQAQANMERFVTGQPAPPSGFDQVRMQKLDESKRENARILGIDLKLAAPEQPELMAMRGLTRWKGLTPQERRALTGPIAEADRITFFSKKWWGIQQLMWVNKHFTAGQKYVQTIEMWTALRARWVEKADTVARKWDKLKPSGQKEALARTLFYMTEMQYLTPQERRQKVVRHPTQQELASAFTQFGLNAAGQALFAEVNTTFSDFLTEFEQIAQKSLRREFVGNPAGLQKAQAGLAADIAAMRAKPYFPLARFGQWTLTVRDSTNQKVEAFYTFSSEAERNRYILIARQQFPMSDLRVSKLPTAMQDYVQLPGPVLKRIKATLPGITPQQKTWLDQLEHQTAPERSFRKHWMTREGTPGYSLDAMRAFSNYLNTGAGYLARLAFKDEAQDVITAATNDAKLNFGGSDKRFDLISEMQEHLNYMLEPGRDGSKLRSFAAMWFLGFSPAAAAMNLTQIPVFTIPYLSSLFEGSAVKRALTAANTALKGTIAAQMRNPPSPGYEKARQELISMGKIDAGQAPELGVYASTDNLTRSAAGEKTQRYWRNFTKASMWMFGKTERYNRELTFAMTFHLAMDAQNSGRQNKYLAELFTNNSLEVLDLISRTGMTQEEALATIAAKEAIDRTQFTFAPWARPKFMRGNPVASDLLVFFGYIQSALYSMRHNPGRIKTLLTMFAMYGMMGLPFAADIDKLVEALARRFGYKDWSPQQEARELIIMLTKESAFEKVGADLFLHGISRFGFGSALLPEGWATPRFDASANGSMGNIIPVLPDAIKGWGHYGKWKEIIGDAAQKGAGAGYGYFFSLLQFLSSDPHTANWKKWEAIMPRALKAASKGTRYATYGEEKSRSGAVIAQFDPRDPEDIATIVWQFLGFTPQKLSVHYENLQQKKESEIFYKGWRMSLYTQLNEALLGGEDAVIKDVLSGIAKYNAEVVRQDLTSMQINTRQAISSLKGRARGRVLEERGLPVTKGAIPLYRKIDESYPLLERKIVK